MKKILVLLSILFLKVPIKALDNNPVLDGNNFYANGYKITIEARNDNLEGATIIWDNGKFDVDSDTVIFGGGKKNSYAVSNITMTGGTVRSIYGGGDGVENISSDVGTSYINIDGGTVRSIYGGGRLSSITTTSNIRVMSGNVGNILGGGDASDLLNTEYEEAIYKNLNYTVNAFITISGGEVFSSIYGGGAGYAHVDFSSIMVSGDAKIEYLTGGGVNGRTDEVKINAIGGNIKNMQSINRGTIGSIDISINGTNIDYLYLAGNDTNASVTGKIDEDGYINLNISSGKINNIKKGINNGVSLPDDFNISVTYMGNSIKSLSELENGFTNVSLNQSKINTPVLDLISSPKIIKDSPFESIIISLILSFLLKQSF